MPETKCRQARPQLHLVQTKLIWIGWIRVNPHIGKWYCSLVLLYFGPFVSYNWTQYKQNLKWIGLGPNIYKLGRVSWVRMGWPMLDAGYWVVGSSLVVLLLFMRNFSYEQRQYTRSNSMGHAWAHLWSVQALSDSHILWAGTRLDLTLI